MIDTEKALEFDKVKEIWRDLALTEWAKQEIQNSIPYLSETELLKKLKETTEARLIIEKCGNPPLVSLNGITEWVENAEKGDCLNPLQLEEIEKALVAVMRVKNYLNKGQVYQISLAYYDENLDELEEIKQAIHMQIRNGRIEDSASKLLKSLRNEIDRVESRMKEKADSIIRGNKLCMSDSFSTFRNGHLCIPVKKEYKFKISGSVIDKSSTGNTLFMEPAAVSRLYDELQILNIDAENEERRILYSLTNMIAEQAEVLKQNIKLIEKLDFIFSKGKLSLEFDGNEPKINTDRKIRIKAGRHPLIDKKSCVPLSLEMGNGISGIVITGPNTGGKTVAMKTVALNCIMAQCGLHVTCKEADICMNSNILCDIGDGQNLSENLSTFSAHITNVLEILDKMDKESFVIMDELGSGTDPTEGMGIAVAILEELKKSGALFLVTTHYPEVKQYAEKEEHIINARMTFDKESLKPLYQLKLGEAGESCAFYIAEKMGMSCKMLYTARKAAYGDDMPEDILENVTAGADMTETDCLKKEKTTSKIQKKKPPRKKKTIRKFQLGDSVMIYPDKKIGIICQPENEKGILRVQLPDKKIWINHKRVKLLVEASELYPEDYDFSIVFDTVQNRKLRHQMERKYTEGEINLE